MHKDTIEKLTGELIPTRATGSPVNAYVNGFEDGIKNTSIDLNDTVTVTLTKRGAEILNEQAKSLNARYNMRFKDNYMAGENYQTSLWTLFEDFGTACSAGSGVVFTNLRLKGYDA